MRAGRRSVPVDVMIRSDTLDDWGQRLLTETLWRQLWGEFTPFRGGELSLPGEVTENPSGRFRFDYMDAMSPDSAGRVLSSDMVMRHDGRLWDIDVVHVDHGGRKYVEVIAISKRLAA